MRVLEINGFFRLPDDWSGTFADALRVLADYHEGTEKRESLPAQVYDREAWWDEFLAAIPDGFRAILSGGLSEVSFKEGTTKSIDVLDWPKSPPKSP